MLTNLEHELKKKEIKYTKKVEQMNKSKEQNIRKAKIKRNEINTCLQP